MPSSSAGVLRFLWRSNRSAAWRSMCVVALLIGAVGGIALASLAGARRTASTFSAYEVANRLSDMAVNTFVPELGRVDAIAALPGVAHSATYLGLNGFPVKAGRDVTDFRYTGVFGSLDGRFLTQDVATIVEGRLPALDSHTEVAMTPSVAEFLGVGVGDEVTYHYTGRTQNPSQPSPDLGTTTYELVGLIELPPVLVDDYDVIQGVVLPPLATHDRLDAFYYAWQGLQLSNGAAGIDQLVERLGSDPTVNSIPPVVQRYDITRSNAQRSVRPQALALGLFGVACGLALLAVGSQGTSRLVGRWSAPAAQLRSLGVRRSERLAIASADAVLAVTIGTALAVAVAVALSPIAPVGAVRRLAPSTGMHVDSTVVFGGAAVLFVALIVMSAVSAWNATQLERRRASRSGSRASRRAARMGLPIPAVIGTRFALDPAGDRTSVPVRSALAGGAIAMIAVVSAIVFGASLLGLINMPAQYGWNWDRMLIGEAGYGTILPDVATTALRSEPDVTAWSLVSFNDVTINGVVVPGLGVDEIEPGVRVPVNRGREPSTPDEIALGTLTLRTLHLDVGDDVDVQAGDHTERLRIVGVVTFPSIGKGGADHTSLGRGALLTGAGLRRIASPDAVCGAAEEALCPSTLLFDLAPRSDGDAVVARLVAKDLAGTPGGIYEQPLTQPADIRNYDPMRRFPLLLAGVLAVAAVAAMALTLAAAVSGRRRELATLKALGFSSGQLRGAIMSQAAISAMVAIIVGIPLGIVVGRLAWIRFAQALGVQPRTVIAAPTLVLLAVAAVAVCLLSAWLPARAAVRTPVADTLRTE